MKNDVQSPKSFGSPKPQPPAFKTPEEVAALDDLKQPAPIVEDPALEPSSAANGWRQRLADHWPPSKKGWIIIVIVLLLLVGGGFKLFHHSAKPLATIKKIPAIKKPTTTTVASTLSGLPVDPSTNKLPVTAVMVENSIDARPQSGLSQAGVVFEAEAEGGVTRFMALYQDTAPTNVGPIRSARPYYIQWALGFDADYAHVGGSPDALNDIKSWGVKDLNQFYNGSYYHRISTRAAPHNVYTGIPTLNQLEAKKGYTTSNYTGFVRNTAAGTPSKQPTARSIKLTLSGPTYNAQYAYDATTNSYNRSEAGGALTDANTGQQLSPKIVVAMVVPETRGKLDSSGAYYSNYNPISSGPVSIFQDGIVLSGTWSKTSNSSQITFTDASGKPIKLDPGQTWLTAVFKSSDISYTP